MTLKPSPWTFHAQVLSRALNELESACTTSPDSPEFKFYRAEAPVVLEEAREALAASKYEVPMFAQSPSRVPTGSRGV